jgi:hypothetical protein
MVKNGIFVKNLLLHRCYPVVALQRTLKMVLKHNNKQQTTNNKQQTTKDDLYSPIGNK